MTCALDDASRVTAVTAPGRKAVAYTYDAPRAEASAPEGLATRAPKPLDSDARRAPIANQRGTTP